LGGVLAITLVFEAAGFWWFDGLSGTVARYEAGVSSQRPIAWFAVANLGALALVLGPAAAVGLARLRRAPVAVLTWAALAGVLAADLSGLSKGEVERIWLIFVPWILVACATIDLRRARGMLALQGLAALAIQTGVRTPW
jgi:methylthioxylose transferase